MTDSPSPARPARYRSFLLRLWQVEGDVRPLWRVSLQDAHTGERHGFADLAALADFLAEQTSAPPLTNA